MAAHKDYRDAVKAVDDAVLEYTLATQRHDDEVRRLIDQEHNVASHALACRALGEALAKLLCAREDERLAARQLVLL